MGKSPKIIINSIQYKEDEKAKEDFLKIVIDFIIDGNIFKEGESIDKK